MKKLIIYHSYTGNTKTIAESIQKNLNCDILELTPKVPFSDDYQEVVDKYQKNSIKDKEIEINEITINLDEYSEIILGSPVWWYTVTPVIATFFKQYDLSNKTIYPFATNAGWLGHTFEDIKKLCPNSIVKNEMNIVFSEDYRQKELITSPEEIDNWINILK